MASWHTRIVFHEAAIFCRAAAKLSWRGRTARLQGGLQHGLPDQIVGQQAGPEFAADHLGTLAAEHLQAERDLDGADVEFCQPALMVKFSEVIAAVLIGVGQGGHHHERVDAKTGLLDLNLDLTHADGRRHAFVGFLIHPLGLGWPLPFDEVIARPQPGAATKIRGPRLVQACHQIDAPFQEQGHHEVGAEIAVGQQDVAGLGNAPATHAAGPSRRFLCRHTARSPCL